MQRGRSGLPVYWPQRHQAVSQCQHVPPSSGPPQRRERRVGRPRLPARGGPTGRGRITSILRGEGALSLAANMQTCKPSPASARRRAAGGSPRYLDLLQPHEPQPVLQRVQARRLGVRVRPPGPRSHVPRRRGVPRDLGGERAHAVLLGASGDRPPAGAHPLALVSGAHAATRVSLSQGLRFSVWTWRARARPGRCCRPPRPPPLARRRPPPAPPPAAGRCGLGPRASAAAALAPAP